MRGVCGMTTMTTGTTTTTTTRQTTTRVTRRGNRSPGRYSVSASVGRRTRTTTGRGAATRGGCVGASGGMVTVSLSGMSGGDVGRWAAGMSTSSGRRSTRTRSSLASTSSGDGGNGGDGGFGGGSGGGGGGDGGDEEDEEDEDEIIGRGVEKKSAEEVKSTCEENGLEFPRDLLDADGGFMRADTLNLYVKYSKYSILAFLMNMFPAVRDRMLADPRFAFKLLVETGADAVMNTAMEIKQRGDTFWDEFEFFACDQVAAFAVNTAILTICSPSIVLGNSTRSMRKLGELSKNANGLARAWYTARKYVASLPPNVFMLDPKLGMLDKLVRGGATVVARGGQIFFVSTLCGTVGQMTANSLMMLRRAAGKDKYSKAYAQSIDDSVDPPVMDTGLLWGRFMWFSANMRQQLVIGGERAVEQFASGMSAAAGRRLANATTIALRVANNIKGGADFNNFVIRQAIEEAQRRQDGSD
jgi:hypothetical protein